MAAIETLLEGNADPLAMTRGRSSRTRGLLRPLEVLVAL